MCRLRPNRCAAGSIHGSDARQDRLFGLGAKALQLADAAAFARVAKLLDGGDVQLFEELCGLLRAKSGDF